MGKFDAAIKKLTIEVEVADQAYADGGEFGVDLAFDTPEEVAQCEAAIRLLEAAGKVDKPKALAWLKHIEQYLESGDGDWQITDEDREMLRLVRLPLDALPD